MADDDGASPREQLIEACRRNNTSLLTDLFSQPPLASQPEKIAHFLNNTTTPLGAGALHVAAQYGSYDVLDLILDQEGVEIDQTERREGDTCLHSAVRYVNGLGKGEWAVGGEGERLVEILVDAGVDPRTKNKAKLRAVDLLDPRAEGVRACLQRAELGFMAGGDVVVEDDDEEDQRRDGPGSESD